MVVAPPVAWSGDGLYPLSIIGAHNASDQDVSVDVYVYSRAAARPPSNDPLLSLQPCNAGDASQRWNFSVSPSIALPGSLVDGALGQCLDVYGCDTAVGTPAWMWPCVTVPGSNCASANQLWSYNGSTLLVSKMTTGYCLSAMPVTSAAVITRAAHTSTTSSGTTTISTTTAAAALPHSQSQPSPRRDSSAVEGVGVADAATATDQCQPSRGGGGSGEGNAISSWSIVMLPCGDASGAVQSFSYDATSGLLAAGGAGAGTCLSSSPPPPSPASDTDTHAGLGLRLGGMTHASTIATAYSASWLNYGYFVELRPGDESAGERPSWALLAGTSTPGQPDAAVIDARRRSRGARTSNRGAAQGPPQSATDAASAASAVMPAATSTPGDPRRVLANGTLAPAQFSLQSWHRLRFTANGTLLMVWLDGVQLCSVHDAMYPLGWAGLSSGWSIVQFANFTSVYTT